MTRSRCSTVSLKSWHLFVNLSNQICFDHTSSQQHILVTPFDSLFTTHTLNGDIRCETCSRNPAGLGTTIMNWDHDHLALQRFQYLQHIHCRNPSYQMSSVCEGKKHLVLCTFSSRALLAYSITGIFLLLSEIKT